MSGHTLCQSLVALLVVLTLAAPAAAQDKGTLDARPLPPLDHPSDPKTAAKQLFGRKIQPTSDKPQVYGFYAHGCVSGAEALPIDGPTWQVMRLSRNRNWGHPNLVKFLERVSAKAAKKGWPGLLVGDMSQPRGGPMITGHASHQVGLDADIWLTPMPDRTLTREEREEMSATNVVATDSSLDVDPKIWTPAHLEVIKAAAEDPEVERIFVNPAIKKALCRGAGDDHAWLHKVRPWYGHDYHFHVRIACPPDDKSCEPQPAVPGTDDGCGAELKSWLKDSIIHPKPSPGGPPAHGMTMSALPKECKAVLNAP
jgi:penicillin-insensitive murein endopeptidase